MQYNYNFHFQMLDVRKIWKFLLQEECPQWFLVWEAQLPSCPTFNMVYWLSNFRKRGFDCFQNINEGKSKFLFLYSHSEKTLGPKGGFWQISYLLIMFVFMAFLYLSSSTVHVVLNCYWEQTLKILQGKSNWCMKQVLFLITYSTPKDVSYKPRILWALSIYI